MSKPLRVGMISYAHVHADFRSRALRDISDVDIVAIADDNETRGRAAATTYGVETFYSDYQSLLARDDIDLVFIHAENNRHAEIVEAAAAAGKHIFCEKPMATTVEDAERIARAVRGSGVRFTVGFCSRYIPEAERAKALVESGALGEISSARAIIGLAGIPGIGCPAYMAVGMGKPAQRRGGPLLPAGSHAVSFLRWCTAGV